MVISDKFYAVNIREYLALGNDPEAGEPALVKLLSGFFCPKNPDERCQYDRRWDFLLAFLCGVGFI